MPYKEITSLSIVIPVFNEERRLPKTFTALNAFLPNAPFQSVEVVFVDDGSRDETLRAIESFRKRHPSVRLVSYPINRGKGFAVKTGMLAATKDFRLMVDADMSTPLSEIQKLVPYIAQECPMIVGTRKAANAHVVQEQPWWRKKLGEGYTLLAQAITGVNVSDFTCGFKCFSKEAAFKIFSASRIDRWSYDAEILFLARLSC